MGFGGRPTTYTPEKAQEICNLVEEGHSIRYIANLSGVPMATIYEWLWRTPEFSELYTRARQAQAQLWGEKALAAIDDESKDIIEQPDGKKVSNTGRIGRVRESLTHYRWLMQCCDPYQFGDKMRMEEMKELEKRIAELETTKK